VLAAFSRELERDYLVRSTRKWQKDRQATPASDWVNGGLNGIFEGL